jgi:hypothetical protein
MKSKEKRVEHVTRMEKTRTAYKILVGKPEGGMDKNLTWDVSNPQALCKLPQHRAPK